MVLGEKIKDPLTHEVRHQLLNIILRHKMSGIRLVELSKITGKKNHSLRHHLDILEEKKLVYTKRNTHQLLYYPDSHIPKHTRIGHPLENEVRSKILELILDCNGKGLHVGALFRKLKISKDKVLKNVKVLQYFDLIDIEEDEKKVFCIPTKKTRKLVKYVNKRSNLFETLKGKDGIIADELEDKIDMNALDLFKLCVFTKKQGTDTLCYLTPFVENILEKNNTSS